MTLVKNENKTLPFSTANQKTVVLVPYDDETIPMDYAVRKLTEDGKLPDGAVVEAVSYYHKTLDDVLPMIEGADNVVFMSEVYNAKGLKDDIAAMADTLADTIHEKGGKFVVMSVSLPYDAARFQKADAIMIAYLARSMPADPGDKVKEMQQYGPNMHAALYVMFSEDDAPTAKLPINIPQLDEKYYFTESVLYARGFGLSYETEEPTTEPQTTETPSTQPEKTTEGTTAALTTIAPVTDATSATQKTTTANNSVTTTNGNGTVQTGEGSLIIASALMLIAFAGIALYYIRYRKS